MQESLLSGVVDWIPLIYDSELIFTSFLDRDRHPQVKVIREYNLKLVLDRDPCSVFISKIQIRNATKPHQS